MSSFVIYLPGRQGANPDHLTQVGLADLCKDGAPEFADCLDGGPDGGRGLLAAWRTGDAARDPSFSVKAFDWQPAKADEARALEAGRFWFGVERGKPAKPADIARRESVAGYPLTLADGQVWRVPAAQHLPHRHGLDANGRYCRQVAEEVRAFWELSRQYFVQFAEAVDQIDVLRAAGRLPANAEKPLSFTCEDAWSYCCQAIAINYRITPEIVDFLGLLDDAAMRNIIKATIEFISILEVRDEKKTEELTISVG